jgi:hypothetical protein
LRERPLVADAASRPHQHPGLGWPDRADQRIESNLEE